MKVQFKKEVMLTLGSESQIQPQKLSEKAFWVRVEEDKLVSPDLLEGLSSRFSSRPPVKKAKEGEPGDKPTSKKFKELKGSPKGKPCSKKNFQSKSPNLGCKVDVVLCCK